MESKHAIVIDGHGNKVEFVIVDFTEQGGKMKEIPQRHVMQDSEGLVFDDWAAANGMISPHWNGLVWEETATPEEIKAVQEARMKELGILEPMKLQPTELELLAAEMTMTISTAVAQLQQNYDMVIAELSMAMDTKGGTDNV